jgi:glutamine amidotransferase
MTTTPESGFGPAVAIIDYGLSNIDSAIRAVGRVGGSAYRVRDASEIGNPDRVLLPGVGVFAVAMEQLHQRGLVGVLDDLVRSGGVPLLGLCLGMQLLASEGDEGGRVAGLGLVPGRVSRLIPHEGERLPHVGWNELEIQRDCVLFDEIPDHRDFYFIHSYHLIPDSDKDIASTTPFAGGFVSVVERDNVFGVQFHPEKSQEAGLRLLENFVA